MPCLISASSSRTLINAGAAMHTSSRLLAPFIKVPQGPIDKTTSPYLTTSPRAVRVRRRLFPPLRLGKDGVHMSPSDRRRYEQLKLKGSLREGMTAQAWIDERNRWRTRVRGIEYSTDEHATDSPLLPQYEGDISPTAYSKQGLVPQKIVGKRIYLPDFVFRLKRNATPLGQPYNPYIATFRVPKSLTKLDIRGYLMTVYGVATTFIRTENIIAKIRPTTYYEPKHRPSTGTYKKAIVGLVEPFYYPDAKEDMTSEERKKREEWEDNTFQKGAALQQRKERMQQIAVTVKMLTGMNTNVKASSSRGKIIKYVLQRKEERERLIAGAMEDMSARSNRSSSTDES